MQKLLTSKRVPIELRMAAKIESMNDNVLKYWKVYAKTNNLVDLLDVKDLSVASYTVLSFPAHKVPCHASSILDVEGHSYPTGDKRQSMQDH